MDITTPSKSLWVVYKFQAEIDKKPGQYFFVPDRAAFPNDNVEFDMALIAADLNDFGRFDKRIDYSPLNIEKVEESMKRTACCLEPLFFMSDLYRVQQAIEEGWAGYGDGQTE